MSNELQSLQQLIEVSAAITETPSLSVKDFGIEREKSTNILIWSGVVSSAAKNTYAKLAGFILSASPILFLGKKIFEYARDKQKAREEKERMYKEIIAKQQAAINRQRGINRQLEILLRESQYDNDKNKEEIVNLRKQVKNLDEVINLLVQSAKQIKQEI